MAIPFYFYELAYENMLRNAIAFVDELNSFCHFRGVFRNRLKFFLIVVKYQGSMITFLDGIKLGKKIFKK